MPTKGVVAAAAAVNASSRFGRQRRHHIVLVALAPLGPAFPPIRGAEGCRLVGEALMGGGRAVVVTLVQLVDARVFVFAVVLVMFAIGVGGGGGRILKTSR